MSSKDSPDALSSIATIVKWVVGGAIVLVIVNSGRGIVLDWNKQQITSPASTNQQIGIQGSPTPNPSGANTQPRLPADSSAQASTKPLNTSPERALKAYAEGLTNRDYSQLRQIWRIDSLEQTKKWLQGTDGKAPIVSVQIVGQPQRIYTSADEVILRSRFQYCRQDGSGSRDTKNYTFIKNQGLWKLDGLATAPEDVDKIRC